MTENTRVSSPARPYPPPGRRVARRTQPRAVGMIVLAIWFLYSGLMSLWGLLSPFLVVAGFILGGTVMKAYCVGSASLYGLAGWGILKRKEWARSLTMVWAVVTFLLSISNLLAFFINEERTLQAFNGILPGASELMSGSAFMWSLVFGAAVNSVITLVVVIYVYRRADYFEN